MFKSLPPVVLNLLIINGLVYLCQVLFPGLTFQLELHKSDALGLHPVAMGPDGQDYLLEHGRAVDVLYFKGWQVVTYFFLHDPRSIFHILFNMIALVSLGSTVETVLGSRRFIEFYLFCGVFAGLGLAFLDPSSVPVLGASTAVSGVLVAFGLLFPTQRLMIFPFPVGIPARNLVIGYFVLTVLLVVWLGGGSNISHFGHLMGMVGALTYFFGRRLLLWLRLPR